jgi:hypothetical protein
MRTSDLHSGGRPSGFESSTRRRPEAAGQRAVACGRGAAARARERTVPTEDKEKYNGNEGSRPMD